MARPQKYDWDLWFNGKKHVLVAGRDFDVDPRTMQSTVLAAAKDRGFLVNTRVWPSHDGKHPATVVVKRQIIARYDWDAFFDGEKHILRHEELRTATPLSFERAARAAAKRRGISVKVEHAPGQIRISVPPGTRYTPLPMR